MDRQTALELLETMVDNINLRKHMFCVEAAMRAYAKKYDANEELWGLTGLLHDADWEKYPDVHPRQIVEILTKKNQNKEMVHAIASHGNNSDQYGDRFETRENLIDKVLFAVDELSGFIVACALVRPDKLNGLEAKSVIKKLKDKRFAAQVSREDIYQGAQELGVDLNEHITFTIGAISSIKTELGLE